MHVTGEPLPPLARRSHGARVHHPVRRGVATPLSKILLSTVDPQLLAGMLYLGAGLGLAFVHFSCAAMGISAPEAPLPTSDIPWLAAVVLFGGLIAPLLLLVGLVHTEAATGSLLLNVEGLATMGIPLMLGALAIITGAIALSWQSRGLAIDTGASLFVGA